MPFCRGEQSTPLNQVITFIPKLVEKQLFMLHIKETNSYSFPPDEHRQSVVMALEQMPNITIHISLILLKLHRLKNINDT